LEYKGKTEKLKYYDNEKKNEISLLAENNILPVKEFIKKEYFDDKNSINTDSLFVEKSEKSLGIKNPECADVEISDNKNTNILGTKNPESADVEISVNKNTNILGIKNSESADEVKPSKIE